MIRTVSCFLWITLSVFCLGWAPGTRAQDDMGVLRLTGVRPTGGAPGGGLVVALRAEPRTFNPVNGSTEATRAVLHRLHANLVNINRLSQKTEPALARRWTASSDGRRFRLELRRGLRFSDGQPMDADDVLFSFQVYLDPRIASPQRDLLLIDGKPLEVRKVDSHTVEVELPGPYAVGDRLFDGLSILPEHRLGPAYREGRFADAWNISTAPTEVVGLGPFRLKRYIPGERVELERNPYYWKVDAEDRPLPYLDSLTFLIVPSRDAQALRFQSGEAHLIDQVPPQSFQALQGFGKERGFVLQDLGPNLTFEFLVFNMNDLPEAMATPERVRKQQWFRDVRFRRAISTAIDREGIVQLVHLGHATPLATQVTPGNPSWRNAALKPPRRSVPQARQLLQDAGFHWSENGRLQDSDGVTVEFTLVTNSSSQARVRTAVLIQEDLRALGIRMQVAELEIGDLAHRLYESLDYEVCMIGLGGGDIDPNPEMPMWLFDGGNHLWHLGQQRPATPWEAEIDGLMRRQMVTLDRAERKRLYDRVQVLVAENLPLVFLVSPNVLVGARRDLGGFQPTILEHSTLWNVEQLYWRTAR